MNRRTRIILNLALFVGAILGAGIWLGSGKSPTRKWSLSDGTEFTLIKVTHGTNHFVIDGGWRDRVYPLVPQALLTRLKWQVGQYGPTASDALVVWLRMDRAPSRGGIFFLETEVAAFDAEGLEGERASAHRIANGMLAFDLRNYPHRSKEFKLRVYPDSREPSKGVGDFRMLNPRPSKASGWSREFLPAARKTNGLEVTLNGAMTGWTDNLGWRSVQTTTGWGGGFSSATFKLQENGVQSRNWKLGPVRATAPTGELIIPNTYAMRSVRDEFILFFQGALWREEPAWKLAVEVRRKGNFPEHELWTVRGVPVPKSREVIEIKAVTNIYGIRAELLGIAGPGAKLPAGWGSSFTESLEFQFRVSLASQPGDLQVVSVGIKDDEGRSLDAELAHSEGGTLWAFRIPFVPDRTRAMDITLAVSRNCTVEFLVKSELAK